MAVFQADNGQLQAFSDYAKGIAEGLSGKARKEDIEGLEKFLANFKTKTEDFYRENRKLNIGVVGQVKAGKSSFLNTLLFGGREILPKASTPKTATLTKMEYSERNIIEIEYYSVEEWEVLEDNAAVDLEEEIYTSARELIGMARKNGINPYEFLEKRAEQVEFDTYGDLIAHLNDYVGEDGTFTPIVKAVTLYLNKEEFQGISIVDTPGLNDPIASRTIRTKEFMEVCDVVFFLSQSGSFLDKSDWTLLSSQLPQKGVKRLVLIASKYDSGIRDILREQEEDDLFGEDENTADNIPKACKIIQKKLRKRAKGKVEDFVGDLRQRGSAPELIEVIKQCGEPVLVSALAYNMTNKPIESYSPEERNVYSALRQFSSEEAMQEDLKLLGNFGQVQEIFAEVAAEKERILEQKSKDFVPTAEAELKGLLEGYQEKADKRLAILEGGDQEQLLSQKQAVEAQIGNIKAEVAAVFGELNARLEAEKANGVRELREAAKEHMEVQERTGTVTRNSSYTTGILFWKKTHYYTYEDHYSYCIASDAVDSLHKYSIDAVNQVEKVFTDALQLKEMKRKILNIVVNNFDMGSEAYDSSLFRIMVEEIVSSIEFPVFHFDNSDAMGDIAAKFSGELISASEKTELAVALSKAVSRIYESLCGKLASAVREWKEQMEEISQKVQESLLSHTMEEFESLLSQWENREREIQEYKDYILALETARRQQWERHLHGSQG